MRLVACSRCHTQYDVTEVVAKTFPCRCGEKLENRTRAAVEAEVRRCGACGALVGAQMQACEYCGSAIVRDRRDFSLICPECLARSADDSRFCTACGIAFLPEPVRAEGHELPCPACSMLMPPRPLAGVALNECPGCNGLWVPGESFDLLVARALETRRKALAEPEATAATPRVTGANPAVQQVKYRKCPECDGYMQRRNFQRSSGVITDVCHDHGTWLDADELEQIAGFLLTGGRPAPLPEAPEPEPSLSPRAAAEFARARAGRELRRAQTESGSGTGIGSLFDLLFDLLT